MTQEQFIRELLSKLERSDLESAGNWQGDWMRVREDGEWVRFDDVVKWAVQFMRDCA